MSLPPPLVPAACDLVGLQWFPIDIDRLLGSQFHQCPDDGAWRAGVTLWLRSMRQVPAGSLPADDEALARLAEFGRDVRGWRRVRVAALRGWMLCSDGRLYHPLIAERAIAAWIGRINEQRRSAAGNRALGRRAASTAQLDAWLSQAREALVMLGVHRAPAGEAASGRRPGRASGNAAGGASDGADGLAEGWPKLAGVLAKTLRFRGVRVSSTDPVLLGWIGDGFSEERILEALEVVRQYKPAPELVAARYLDKVLRDAQRGAGNGRQAADRDAAREQRAAALTGRDAAGGGAVIEGEFGPVGAAADPLG